VGADVPLARGLDLGGAEYTERENDDNSDGNSDAHRDEGPKAELTVQRDAGHFPWLDDPAGFTETVAGFLDRGDWHRTRGSD